MDGCQEARNAITIFEIPCPRCTGSIEFFIKDGFLAVDALCDTCGYTVPPGSSPEHWLRPSNSAQRGDRRQT